MTTIGKTVALLTVSVVAAAGLLLPSAAQAATPKITPVHTTGHFTVGHDRFTIRERSYGKTTDTLYIGSRTVVTPDHVRVTITGPGSHVISATRQHFYKAATIYSHLTGTLFKPGRFATRHAFDIAEHKALHVTDRAAKATYLQQLRRLSVELDLAAASKATRAYLTTVPDGATPDFSQVKIVTSLGYTGTATVTGSDHTHWTVTIRDTQDGRGARYNNATGIEQHFHL